MSINLSGKSTSRMLTRHLDKAKKDQADSLAKLASGKKFAGSETMPAQRAISESMEFRIRSLSASKRNVNDAISLLQTAESAMSEINNIINRMKEINIAAAGTTVSDQERRFLFIEYEALHSEVDRIAETTEFNGIPLLDSSSDAAPEELIFRIDDPHISESSWDSSEDINAVRFDGLSSINATTEGLGLRSAVDLLDEANDEEGIIVEDVEEMLLPEDTDLFATAYDQALGRLATQRAIYGSLQSRLNRSLEFLDVYQENLSAANSKIADTDYAEETANLLQARVAVSATTALMAQGNIDAQHTLQLLNSIT